MNPTNPPDSALLRTPLQSRSEETLRRFLEAAEGLLDEGSFDDVSIAGLAERAERSVGAFYARFDSKEALFNVLQRRLVDELQHGFSESLQTSQWTALDLRESCRRLVRLVADLYREHRGVLRAVSLRARLRSDREIEGWSPNVNEGLYHRAVEILGPRMPSLPPDLLERRARLGLSMVAATLREHVLFDEIGLSPVQVDHDTLVVELADCLEAYLSTPGTRRSPSAPSP